jgi:integrase
MSSFLARSGLLDRDSGRQAPEIFHVHSRLPLSLRGTSPASVYSRSSHVQRPHDPPQRVELRLADAALDLAEGGLMTRRKGKKMFGYWLPNEGGRKYFYGFKSRTAAKEELDRKVRVIERGGDAFSPDMTFGSYVPKWFEHKRAQGRRAHTLHRYEGLLRDDIEPIVGDLELRKIRPAHARAVLDGMKQRGSSLATVTQARAVFRGVMQQALIDGLIETNPVSAVARPPRERREKAVPKPEQVKAVIELSRGTEMEIPVLLGATTGARRSEVSGLQWPDTDLKTGRLTIRRGLQWMPVGADERGRTRRELQFTDPKTPRARRSMRLLPVVVERLREHRKDQMERRLALGEKWNATHRDVVCDRGDGRPIDPDAFTKAFKRLAAQAGLDPRTHLHNLRDGVGTQLARKGVHPFEVSRTLGHSSTTFTMDTYTDAWDEGALEAAAAPDEALNL